ncbi:MAG: proton-conducting transporter membrane subunit [Myxococcales bacterium]|nr:proton-conducting transporter membrane subunit [Myxococcales bacterium]
MSWLVLLGVGVLLLSSVSKVDLRVRGAVAGLWSAVVLAAFDNVWLETASVWSTELSWLPELGISLALRADGLSALFVNLVAGIGILILPYTGFYLASAPGGGRTLTLLVAFQAAMLGVVVADDLMTLFVAWELTSVISFLLISAEYRSSTARSSGRHALLITGLGGLCLLGGMVVAAESVGSYRISELIRLSEGGAAIPSLATALMLVGCLTKSAIVPFHSWLPLAMAAPTPVSAYLHSATMVKAGVFLLLRLDPLLSRAPFFTPVLVGLGLFTLVYAGYRALRVSDFKQVLAWTTIAALGTVTAAIGLNSGPGIKAALVFIVVHALYKSSFFMLAGTLEKLTGTRDLRLLSGLRHSLPLGALTGALAGLSMAGVPPLVGFMGKELLYKANLASREARWAIALVAVVGNALAFAAAVLVGLEPFRKRGRAPTDATVNGKVKLLAVLSFVPAAASLLLGVAPEWLADRALERAVQDVLRNAYDVKLSLWYGFDLALALSAVTVVAGLLVWRHRLRHEARWLRAGASLDLWMSAFERLPSLAKALVAPVAAASTTGWLLAAVVLAGWLGFRLTTSPGAPAVSPTGGVVLEALCLVVAASGALAACWLREKLACIAALGISGSALAVWFLARGAPDVGTTQLLVEAVSLLVLSWAWLRAEDARGDRVTPTRADDAKRSFSSRIAAVPRLSLAIGCGVLLSAALWQGAPWSPDGRVADAMIAASYPEARGSNVVNVIIVDFRMFDTFGESLAVALGGLMILVLLAPTLPRVGLRAAKKSRDPSAPPSAMTARLLGWLLLTLSLPVLYRGHDAPGGGFIAGLVAGMGVILLGIVIQPTSDASGDSRYRRLAVWLLASGVVLASAATLPSLIVGRPLATNLWLELPFPPGKVGTPLLFDAGVYLAVIGFCAATYSALRTAGLTSKTQRAFDFSAPQPRSTDEEPS